MGETQTQDDQQQAVTKPPISIPAVLSIILAPIACLPTQPLSIPLAIWGLIQTRGNRRRGRGAAKHGLALGLLFLIFYLGGLPIVFFEPPIHSDAREVNQWMDQIASRDYQEAYKMVGTALNYEEFVSWADMMNDEYGRGRIVWMKVRSNWLDGYDSYFIWFEKVGIRVMGITKAYPEWSGGPPGDPYFFMYHSQDPPSLNVWETHLMREKMREEFGQDVHISE